MNFDDIMNKLLEEFKTLTLRERSIVALMFEDKIEDLEEYKKAINKYKEGKFNSNTKIIKGSKDNNYIVEYYDDGKFFCSCPHFQYRLNQFSGKKGCKHIEELKKKQ